MINGMLNTEWVKAMLKKYGPMDMPELRALRASAEGDGSTKSVSCAVNDLVNSGDVIKAASGKWALATSLGWSGIFSAMKPPVRSMQVAG
ncbi:MAG: hypothetical protein ACRCT2_02910 [Plesiomonas shigelloides]